MRFAFNYVCHVGAVMPDGDMTTMVFGANEVIEPINMGCLTLEARTHQDFELKDGTVILDVPLAAIRLEPEHADCV